MIVKAYIKSYGDNGKHLLDIYVTVNGVECCLAHDCLDLEDVVECINVVTKGLNFNILHIGISVAGKNGVTRTTVSREKMLDPGICAYLAEKVDGILMQEGY